MYAFSNSQVILLIGHIKVMAFCSFFVATLGSAIQLSCIRELITFFN